MESAYQDYRKELGELFGQSVSVLRPPGGTTIDQTPTTAYTSQKFKIEKTGPKLSQPGLYNMEYYAIEGDTSILQPGDILLPDSGLTPPVTFIGRSTYGEEFIGFRTSRTCTISRTDSSDTNIYTNVYFDFLPTGFPRSQFDELGIGASTTPTKVAVIYTLSNFRDVNISANDYEIEGLLFTDTSGSSSTEWRIKFAEEVGPITQIIMSH